MFRILEIFWFLAQKRQKWGGKTELENITIWYAFYKKTATYRDFVEFQGIFLKKSSVSPKNTLILNVLKILLFQSHSTASVPNFGGEKYNEQKRDWTSWTQTANITYKKKTFSLMGKFRSLNIKYFAKYSFSFAINRVSQNDKYDHY